LPESSDRVCVIIVNFNGGEYLARCLEALNAQTRRPDHVIVADNGSVDASVDNFEARYPNIELLRLGKNLGFSEANNVAVRYAEDMHWVALLNPDAFPHTHWLDRLLTTAGEHPEYEFFGSRLINAVNPELLDGDGDNYHVSGAAWRHLHGVALKKSESASREIFSPCAAAALYDRGAFLAAGGFDKRFFCYLEDVDLGFRLRLAGHRALQVSDALVYHVGSGITGGMSDFSLFYIQRNLVWTFFKNMPLSMLLRYLPQHLLLNLLGILALMRRGEGGVALRAKWAAVKGLAAVLRDRREIQETKQTDDASMEKLMEKGWLTPYRRDKELSE